MRWVRIRRWVRLVAGVAAVEMVPRGWKAFAEASSVAVAVGLASAGYLRSVEARCQYVDLGLALASEGLVTSCCLARRPALSTWAMRRIFLAAAV